MTLLKTYLSTHNVDSISQDDSSVSLPIKLKVIKMFIIICIIYFYYYLFYYYSLLFNKHNSSQLYFLLWFLPSLSHLKTGSSLIDHIHRATDKALNYFKYNNYIILNFNVIMVFKRASCIIPVFQCYRQMYQLKFISDSEPMSNAK